MKKETIYKTRIWLMIIFLPLCGLVAFLYSLDSIFWASVGMMLLLIYAGIVYSPALNPKDKC